VRVVYSPEHARHDPRHDIQGGVAAEMVERPARAERILSALTADGGFHLEAPTAHGRAPIQAVHAHGMIRLLEEASRQAGDTELFPDSFRHAGFAVSGREPEDLNGRLGWWCFDTGTPILAGSYAAARAAVDAALTAADLVLDGERAAYALCRPPGHHAAHAMYGGFCYFNNAAIAAEYVGRRTRQRVAILDLDYHHGNGTQQIFYAREDVLYVSLHADPPRAFPYFSGHADETGTGPGLGATRNLPLPSGTTDAEYLVALDQALEYLQPRAAGVTIVSLGIDTYVHDPLGDFALTTAAYAECGRRLNAVGTNVLVLQEGGYYLPDLGENVRQFLLALRGA
jgi:acetoin utilization deacetylase AcuC-like enzyme